MPPVTTLLREQTADLDQSLVAGGGLYHLRYALRNPPVGPGRGLDGVDDDGLIRAYADGLDAARRLLIGWGWPEPPRSADGSIPAWVFRTDRLGFGDCPLTIPIEHPGGRTTSELALRATVDTPRLTDRLDRARVEAAHEATHTFTHQYVSPRHPLGVLWAWFDEATAVFVEAEAFPDSAEARRFGLYWNHCPEWDLTSWGGYGGYFAAWFVRYLADRFGRPILHEVWAAARGQFGPLQVLDGVLAGHKATFSDVFADYCAVAAAGGIDPPVAELFGRRSLTESFRAPTGRGAPAALGPLACRYFRVGWDEATAVTPVHLRVDGAGTLFDGELRVEVLAVLGGAVVSRHPLALIGPGEWAAELAWPDADEQLVIVSRVAPPPAGRTPPRPAVTLHLTLGAAVPGTPYRTVTVGGAVVPLPADLVDVTDYTFLARRVGDAPPARMTVVVAAPGEGPSAADLATAYRDGLVDDPAGGTGGGLGAGSGGSAVQPLDLPYAPDAIALEHDFDDSGAPWKERIAFVPLGDGGTAQLSVTAAANEAAAAEWFQYAVSGLRLQSQIVRLRVGGGRATTAALAPPPFAVVEWAIGNAVVPVPAELSAPPATAVAAADNQFAFEIPAGSSAALRGGTAALAAESAVAVGGEWAIPGSEQRLVAARDRVLRVLTTLAVAGSGRGR